MLFAEVTLIDWIGAGSIVVGTVIILIILRRVVGRIESQTTIDENTGALITQISSIIIVILAALYAMALLEISIGPLLGALGISGVIIGLSLQPVLGNFIGSVMLNSSRPIRVGDQIETNGISGTVVDIGARSTELLTFDGVAVHLPNLQVLEQPLANFTADEDRRTIMPFQVSYDTDLRHAQQVVTAALRAVPIVNEIPAPEVVVRGFGASGVDLEARFWHASEELIAQWAISEGAIAIRESLQQESIEIPFPQRVLHTATPPTDGATPADPVTQDDRTEPSDGTA